MFAYQWYPADAALDRNYVVLNLEEKGAFHTLYDIAWMNDGLPNDDAEIQAMLKLDGAGFARLWPRVSRCYPVDEQDATRRINRRQEAEKAAQRSGLDRMRAGAALTNARRTPPDPGSERYPPRDPPLPHTPYPIPQEREREPALPDDRPDPAEPVQSSRLIARLALHPKLDTPAVRTALARWEAHRDERGVAGYTASAAESAMLAWEQERYGPDWLVRSVEVWIQKNAKQWFDPDDRVSPPPAAAPAVKADYAAIVARGKASRAAKRGAAS